MTFSQMEFRYQVLFAARLRGDHRLGNRHEITTAQRNLHANALPSAPGCSRNSFTDVYDRLNILGVVSALSRDP
jgi:hypothetical protein